MKYIYYPGCNAEEVSPQLDKSSRNVAKKLGIELLKLDSLSCCGSSALDETNQKLNYIVNARNFALAEKEKLDIVTPCSTCYNVMKKANKHLRENPRLLSEVNDILHGYSLEYKGTTEIKNFLGVLVYDYGIEKLREEVVNPLKKLRIAPFYGCHILRPGDEILYDNTQNPKSMELLIETLGAVSIDFKEKFSCCGLHVMMANSKLTNKMVDSVTKDAKDSSANCIATPCTLCVFSLDANQKVNIPVIHVMQLVGLSLNMSSKELGLSKHMVNADILSVF